jgi:predicted O-methyltransferase YrrM
MRQAELAKGALLAEYHRATSECPHPERWSMYDSMTAEAEVLEFIRTLVTTIKPNLVVETGSFLAVSTLWIAEGLKRNGFGKVVSCEFDPVVYAKARENVTNSGLAEWIDLRNESSPEMQVDAGGVLISYSATVILPFASRKSNGFCRRSSRTASS